MTGRYVNPYTDFGFKLLFGTPMNKDLFYGCDVFERGAARACGRRPEGSVRRVLREREGGAVHCGDAEGTAEIFQRPERVLFDFSDPGAGKSGGLGL